MLPKSGGKYTYFIACPSTSASIQRRKNEKKAEM